MAFTPNHMDGSWDFLFRQRSDEYALHMFSICNSIHIYIKRIPLYGFLLVKLPEHFFINVTKTRVKRLKRDSFFEMVLFMVLCFHVFLYCSLWPWNIISTAGRTSTFHRTYKPIRNKEMFNTSYRAIFRSP